MTSLVRQLSMSSAALARFRAVRVVEFILPAWPELAPEHERVAEPADLRWLTCAS